MCSLITKTIFNHCPPLSDIIKPNNLDKCEIRVNQQPTKISLMIPKGITVRWHANDQVKLCEMTSSENKNGIYLCKVKVQGSNDIVIVAQSSVEPVCTSNPSVISEDVNDIDAEMLQDKLPHGDLKTIWNKVDTSCTYDEKLFIYWYQCTRHSPMNISTG